MNPEGNKTANPNDIDLYPVDDNAINIFKNKWLSALPNHEGKSGKMELFKDKRLLWFLSRNPVKNKTILELGPLEGGHTYMLEKLGGGIVEAIEINRNCFFKCLTVKNVYNLRSKFYLGNFLEYIRNTKKSFDVIFASGILYHMQDPLDFLENISKLADTLFIWTMYWTEENMGGEAKKEPTIVLYKGKEIIMHEVRYKISTNASCFMGGISPTAHWMDRQSILDVLSLLGFNELTIGEETGEYGLGQSFCILANRR